MRELKLEELLRRPPSDRPVRFDKIRKEINQCERGFQRDRLACFIEPTVKKNVDQGVLILTIEHIGEIFPARLKVHLNIYVEGRARTVKPTIYCACIFEPIMLGASPEIDADGFASDTAVRFKICRSFEIANSSRPPRKIRSVTKRDFPEGESAPIPIYNPKDRAPAVHGISVDFDRGISVAKNECCLLPLFVELVIDEVSANSRGSKSHPSAQGGNPFPKAMLLRLSPRQPSRFRRCAKVVELAVPDRENEKQSERAIGKPPAEPIAAVFVVLIHSLKSTRYPLWSVGESAEPLQPCRMAA